MTSGIYALWWEQSDKLYIGKSVDVESRYKEHLSTLKRGIHCNKLVTNQYSLYNEPTLIIIEEASDLDNMKYLEEKWIEELDTLNSGLNINCNQKNINWGANKFSKVQILEVFKLLYSTSLTYKEISEKTKVTHGTITAIKNKKVHLWLEDLYPLEYEKMTFRKSSMGLSGRTSISKNTILRIFSLLYRKDLKYKEIAKITGVSTATVSHLKNGARYLWLKREYPVKYKLMQEK